MRNNGRDFFKLGAYVWAMRYEVVTGCGVTALKLQNSGKSVSSFYP